MEMVGSGENITGEELLKRYAAGERNFPLISLYDEKCVLEGANLRGINMMGGIHFVNAKLKYLKCESLCMLRETFRVY